VNPFNIYVNLFHMDRWRRIYDAAPWLSILGWILAADLVFTAFGLVIDHRMITGAPAWLKPLKFAISTLIASWSFAFCLASVAVWPRIRRALDVVLALNLLVEIVLIDLQAWRGTSSHFNVGTGFDGVVYGTMGVSIALVWLSMVGLTIALFRQPFGGSAWGWSLRLGMMLGLIGTGSGALMTVPNSAQLAQAHGQDAMKIVGGHTVGAPDGGRGLPVTGWSADHGDLRIAHFVGMHGLQILPLLAWWLGRRTRLGEGTRRNVIFVAAAGYLGFFGLVLWQAFRGQSIAQPDTIAIQAFSAWLGVFVVTTFLVYRKGMHDGGRAVSTL
jgi:hypothetical protein